jgi:hypothetical protein
MRDKGSSPVMVSTAHSLPCVRGAGGYGATSTQASQRALDNGARRELIQRPGSAREFRR